MSCPTIYLFFAVLLHLGFPITFENMKAMMEYFCNKRSCVRMELTVPTPVATKEETTAPPIVLTIDGIGKMACRSDQEPAGKVECSTIIAKIFLILIF